jgi:hypothetical protein
MTPLHATDRSLDNAHIAALLERMAACAERGSSTADEWRAAAHFIRRLDEDIHDLLERVGPGDVANATGLSTEIAAALFEAAATGTIAALTVASPSRFATNDDDDDDNAEPVAGSRDEEAEDTFAATETRDA